MWPNPIGHHVLVLFVSHLHIMYQRLFSYDSLILSATILFSILIKVPLILPLISYPANRFPLFILLAPA